MNKVYIKTTTFKAALGLILSLLCLNLHLFAQVTETELLDYLEVTDERLCEGITDLSPDVLDIMEKLYHFEHNSENQHYEKLSLNASCQILSGQHKVQQFKLTKKQELILNDDLFILSEGDVLIDGKILGKAIENSHAAGQHLVIKTAGKIIIRGDIRLSDGGATTNGSIPVYDQPLAANSINSIYNQSMLSTTFLNQILTTSKDSHSSWLCGGLGGSLFLSAQSIEITGTIQVGNGGNAQAGGNGGFISLLSGNTYYQADLKAGDGGNGGTGGNGGDAQAFTTITHQTHKIARSSGIIRGGNGGHGQAFWILGGGDVTGTNGGTGGNGGDGVACNGGNGNGGNGGNGATGSNGGTFSAAGDGGSGGDGGNGVGGDSASGTGGSGTGGNGGAGGNGGSGGTDGDGGAGGAGGDGNGGDSTSGNGGSGSGGAGGDGGDGGGTDGFGAAAGAGGNGVGGDSVSGTGGSGAGGDGGDGGDGATPPAGGFGAAGGTGGDGIGGDGSTAGSCTAGNGGNRGNGGVGSPAFDGACTPGSVVLPVAWGLFEVEEQVQGVLLKWQSLSELNNQGFEVQKSRDGQNWAKLDFVTGAGTSNQPNDYLFLDIEALLVKTYYRLKQIDYDGTFDYSKVLVASPKKIEADLYIYPNPTVDVLQLPELKAGASVFLFNAQGQLLQQLYLNDAQELSLANLPKGMYWLQSEQQGVVRMGKVFKL